LIMWMIFGSRLLSSFSMSALHSFLKYLCYTKARIVNGPHFEAQNRPEPDIYF